MILNVRYTLFKRVFYDYSMGIPGIPDSIIYTEGIYCAVYNVGS